ncbi:imidazole glycerol phosphate synthase subunit HisH [Pseudomonas sp. LS44]|uniref:imidazole glycerol phosphate synthase subunit HisH n=1 Tax=Pseudomonas sp. LS44 TaxID=1357074 RepID=UPI00215B263E|nr:imidazole glycerol phosphate synthase subunit HisH [Pseudomonas sp. LS44]UVE19040.1 imidazole glycerol phosphate synthase subunit HisH [Pseudomonas sp. LS44]
MIHIIDYGLGNIQAFVTMYKRLGIEAVRAKGGGDLRDVRKLILPGVGAFDHAMELLDASGMRQPLERLVREDKVPVLGICVGMQILARSSEEGVGAGLGWVDGRVRSFADNPAFAALPMPHMGWNDVVPAVGSPLFKGLEENARFYFLHSYYFECSHMTNVAARADYGFQFACAVQNGNVFGVQFHPEKSHHWGAALLKNFAEL